MIARANHEAGRRKSLEGLDSDDEGGERTADDLKGAIVGAVHSKNKTEVRLRRRLFISFIHFCRVFFFFLNRN